MNMRLGQLLHRFKSNVLRPFALAHHQPAHLQGSQLNPSQATPARARSDTMTDLHEKQPSQSLNPTNPHVRSPSKPTFFSRVLRSDGGLGTGSEEKDHIGLPFRLSVYTAHSQVERNVPYLRHSWNRIDFVAIVAFWIAFALATAGVEQTGSRHIAVFRALSVMRTSRLLAVTSGTTVRVSRNALGDCSTLMLMLMSMQTIMRSLKRARPLLTNVAYFVIFAMVLFS